MFTLTLYPHRYRAHFLQTPSCQEALYLKLQWTNDTPPPRRLSSVRFFDTKQVLPFRFLNVANLWLFIVFNYSLSTCEARKFAWLRRMAVFAPSGRAGHRKFSILVLSSCKARRPVIFFAGLLQSMQSSITNLSGCMNDIESPRIDPPTILLSFERRSWYEVRRAQDPYTIV